MAKDCYSYQLNIIKRLGLPLPLSVKPSDIDFQQYFTKYMSSSTESVVSTIKMFSNLYSINPLTVMDILQLRDFQKVRKPIMIVSPQMSYTRVFMNAYSGIFKSNVFWVSDLEDFENLLVKLQCNTFKQAPLIMYMFNNTEDF